MKNTKHTKNTKGYNNRKSSNKESKKQSIKMMIFKRQLINTSNKGTSLKIRQKDNMKMNAIQA
jgi:hypothetical protein